MVRVLETILGNVFVWSGTVFYAVYDQGEELWGIGPLQDQGLAGAVMMIEGSLVTIVALAWLFLRLAREGELRQELLERGLDPRAVRRAVRYGRAQELAGRR
jgi:cytochrome c oxidase assembly factor CtaG